MSERRYRIIGAGYAGYCVAKALTDAGIRYDQLEATDHVGGKRAHGIYDSTHITTRLPTTWCAFASRAPGCWSESPRSRPVPC